jgi:hypothetical protein
MARPGSRLRAFASGWCDERTLALIVDPAIADLQRQPSIRNYIGVLQVFALCAAREVIMSDATSTADERGVIGATLMWSGAFVAALIALLLVVSNRITPSFTVHPGPMRYVYLLPGAAVIALTFGLALGFVVALRGRHISVRLAAFALAIAVVASTASFVSVGWLAPAASQSFRALMSGVPAVDPGIPELTLGELAEKIDVFSGPQFSQFGYLHALSFNYYQRLALTFGPLVSTIFALSIGAAIRSRWVQLICAVLASALYWMAINARQLMPWNSGLSSFTAAWTANLLLLAAASTLSLIAFARARSRVSLSA